MEAEGSLGGIFLGYVALNPRRQQFSFFISRTWIQLSSYGQLHYWTVTLTSRQIIQKGQNWWYIQHIQCYTLIAH